MTKYRYIILICLLGWCATIFAGGCFELTNYYYSRPTNYTTRGGDNWMATGAAVEPTSSMYFSSPYEYVMLTGGNKNTAPGQLQVTITPQEGIDTLTFQIAKPCISDRYSGAGVYVFADGNLVWSQVVMASSLSYQEVVVPIDKDCEKLEIRVTNYYTNTTTAHNNRIAFAHFCWSDYSKSQHSDDPEQPLPPTPISKMDTVEYSMYACYNQVPYEWNGIACVKTDDYVYTMKNANGEDSTTILHFVVSPQPVLHTEQVDMKVGEQLMWHNYIITPTKAEDIIVRDTVYDSQYGCPHTIYTLNVHVNKAIVNSMETYLMCAGQTITIHGKSYCAPTGQMGVVHQEWVDTLVSSSSSVADSLVFVSVWVSAPTVDTHIDTAICRGDSFTWFGQMVSEANTYFHYIPSQLNNMCDSVRYILRVKYLPQAESEEKVSVCSTQLPFYWHGNSYEESGSYIYRTTSSLGCDSVVTLRLTVEQPVLVDTTIWCSSDDLPYYWYQQTLVQSGTYTNTLSSPQGCDSIITLHFNVLASPIEQHLDTAICQGSAILWRNRWYETPGIYYDTLRYSTCPSCDSVYYILSLENNMPSQHIDTVVLCSNELPYNWNGHQIQVSGLYKDTFLNIAGCDSIAILWLQVLKSDTINITRSICHEQLPYHWNGMPCSSANNYTYVTQNQMGCDSVVILHLEINSYSSSDTMVWLCPNDVPFLWHGHSISVSGTTQWTTTNSVGCDSIVTVQAYLSSAPMSIQEDTSICAGESVQWHGRLIWTAGLYYDTVYTNSPAHCDSIYYTLHVSHRQPTQSIIVDTICAGETYLWHGHTFGQSVDEMEVLTNAAGCDSICQLHLHVRPYAHGSMTVETCYGDSVFVHGRWLKHAGEYTDIIPGASAYGCDSICDVFVKVLPQPQEEQSTVYVYPDELPYNWRGTDYSEEGVYVDTIKNTETGCDVSRYILNLHILDACETKPRVQ